jgi:NAD(P)H-dependent FMN reductase
MAPLYLPVLFGTVRKANRSHAVARFVLARGEQRPDVETRLFDPATLPFANLVESEWEMEPRPPGVAAFVGEMERADGFVIVTPEYNFGMPGALKNLLDHLYDEWNRKPFGLVGVGGISGGNRALDALRLVIAGVGAVSVPRPVSVPNVTTSFADDGPITDVERVTRSVDRLWEDMEWYARALKDARARDPPP